MGNDDNDDAATPSNGASAAPPASTGASAAPPASTSPSSTGFLPPSAVFQPARGGVQAVHHALRRHPRGLLLRSPQRPPDRIWPGALLEAASRLRQPAHSGRTRRRPRLLCLRPCGRSMAD